MDNKVDSTRVIFDIIELKGEKKLGIFTGVSSRIFANSDMIGFKKDTGWYRGPDGHLSEWRIEGLTEIQGKVVFYGPLLDITPLEEDYCPDEEEFLLLKKFLCDLDSRKENEFSSYHIAKMTEGGFFQFPPFLMKEVIGLCINREIFPLREYRHPDLFGDKAFSFALALIQLRMLCGHPLWIEQEDEAMNHEIRERILPDFSRYVEPADSGRLIWRALQKVENGPGLDEWRNYRPIETKECPEALAEELRKSYKRFYQKRYALKNRVKLMVLGVAAAFAIYLGVKLILNILAPPYTEGMSQLEVVELYYQSWAAMDVTTVDELVLHRSEVDSQQNLDIMYVTNMVRESNNLNNRILTPQQWIDEKKTRLEEGEFIFGISDMEITQLSVNEFETHYYIWYPPTGEDDQTQPTRVIISEKITLEQKKDAWFIGSVETEEKLEIKNPE